jgi:TetR/AcrR family transcriptional regulator
VQQVSAEASAEIEVTASSPADGDEVVSTRESLLRAATIAFSTTGYAGASVRHIERMATTNRGLVAYHFGSKDALWRAVVVRQMEYFREEFERFSHLLHVVPKAERAGVLLRVYARFVAKHPELFRMLVLEGGSDTDRLTWLVDEHLSKTREFFNTLADLKGSPRAEAVAYYLMTGASSYVFSVAPQCMRMFGFDPTTVDFVDHYVGVVADIDYSGILRTD